MHFSHFLYTFSGTLNKNLLEIAEIIIFSRWKPHTTPHVTSLPNLCQYLVTSVAFVLSLMNFDGSMIAWRQEKTRSLKTSLWLVAEGNRPLVKITGTYWHPPHPYPWTIGNTRQHPFILLCVRPRYTRHLYTLAHLLH